ncbi:PD-(D/E)XK nuclease family protein [Psychrobacter sp. I-STPA6b]|uniref:PDDEXK-like family protein n=1 Tax=Psychrobacter sp. I-STPA6b TaxID=2585718 RepID=UPI001D0C500E|nr:PD-(D/E)XK nuclease family protein [Psychrobacter sp. I-STPA6b]
MNNVKTLLGDVSRKIDTLQTAQALYSKQLAPNFSVFDYISTNETGLSYILADLLNPQGSHDQEETFLKLFIEHCLPDISSTNENQTHWQPLMENLHQVSVLTEQTTWASKTKRRMDIYLETEINTQCYGICIENKPYAGDQENQLKDYAIELEKRCGDNWHLVYLKEYNEDFETGNPSEDSIDKKTLNHWLENKKFTVLKFSQLINWLKACQSECQNQSVNEFLNQFIKFIQQQFMGVKDMNEEQAILELMTSNSEAVDASFKISRKINDMKNQLIDKLIHDLKLKINEESHSYKYNLTYSENLKRSCGRLYFQIDEPQFYICFEFEGTMYNLPALGIMFKGDENNDTHKYKDEQLYTRIQSLFQEKFSDRETNCCPQWAGWYEFQPHDWKNSSEPWKKIQEGKMAEKILKEVDDIYQLLKDNNCIK